MVEDAAEESRRNSFSYNSELTRKPTGDYNEFGKVLNAQQWAQLYNYFDNLSDSEKEEGSMILYFADRVKGMKSKIMLLTVKEGRPKAFAAYENASEIEDTIKSIYEEYESYGENTKRILERVFRCVYEESLRQVSVGTVGFDTSNGSENFQNGVHGIIDEMGKRGKKSGGISGLVIGADGTSDEIIRGRSRTITGGTIKFSISDKMLAEQKAAAEKEAKRQAELADYYKSQLKLATDYRMDPAGGAGRGQQIRERIRDQRREQIGAGEIPASLGRHRGLLPGSDRGEVRADDGDRKGACGIHHLRADEKRGRGDMAGRQEGSADDQDVSAGRSA